jgi:hypothetical protein
MIDANFRHSYFEETRRRRGLIIEKASMLERFIDIYIASHFCYLYWAKIEFMKTVLASSLFNAERKRRLFDKLIKKHELRFAHEEKETLNRIRSIYSYRNKYAHQPIIASDEALELFRNKDAITLLKYDDKEELTKLHLKEFNEHIADADKCAIKIRLLLEERKYLPLVPQR